MKNNTIISLQDRYNIRTLKFEINTTGSTIGLMKIIFSNKSIKDDLNELQFANSIVQEFSFPARAIFKNRKIDLIRKIRDLDSLKNARYVCITNSTGDDWEGYFSFYIDKINRYTSEKLKINDDKPWVDTTKNLFNK